MAGLDLAECKLAEIGRNVVIIHDPVQLSRIAQPALLKSFVNRATL